MKRSETLTTTTLHSQATRGGPNSKKIEQKDDKIERQGGHSRASFAFFVLIDYKSQINQATEERERRYANEEIDFERSNQRERDVDFQGAIFRNHNSVTTALPVEQTE